MSQWIYDDKSVYIRKDLAYKIIRYINQGVIEANEFRKKLSFENDKSVRREREIIAIIMKLFAKGSMTGRQQKIPGLSYLADLCFMLLFMLLIN